LKIQATSELQWHETVPELACAEACAMSAAVGIGKCFGGLVSAFQLFSISAFQFILACPNDLADHCRFLALRNFLPAGA
jgi:hypothetical protein